MCIAIFSPAGVGYPNKDIMKRCFRNNPDGIGYAYLTTKNEWSARKGIMYWKEFWELWQNEGFEDDHTVMLHFRVGTSGKTDEFGWPHPDCTHPFPVSDETEKLMENKFTTPNIIMHNGVVGRGEGDLSDTQCAIRDYATTLLPYMDDAKIRNLLTEILDAGPKGSRWFMACGDQYYIMGDWINEKDTGLWYSNDGYLPEVNFWKKVKQSWNGNVYTPPSSTILLKGRISSEFMKDNKWDWDKWDKEMSTSVKDKGELVVVPSIPNDTVDYEDGISPIYDKDGNVMALVDEGSGETVWDDINAEIEGSLRCEHCDALITTDQLEYGLCPWCHLLVTNRPVEGNEDMEEMCPECEETSYLIESTFDKGDTECCRCGALFLNTVRGVDSIVGWNEDTRGKHDEMIRACQGL